MARLESGATRCTETRSASYDAGASRLRSRHDGREPVSTPLRRRSGVRTLTNREPAAFPAPSSQIRLASTCRVPASSFCGRSFQTRKTSIRSSSRAAEPPFGVLFSSSGFFSQVDVGADAFEVKSDPLKPVHRLSVHLSILYDLFCMM